jgi:outer membrane immunogenic protein
MRSVSPGLVALALAAMAVAAPVYAADMSVAPAYNPPAPVPPATYNWTAFYVGGNIGAGLLHDSATQAAPGAVTLPGSFNVNPIGLVGGAQAGVDYQFSAAVVGAQVSWSATYLNANSVITASAPAATQERLTSDPSWFATATGRVGYAANTLLFYVKGGGAWMHIEHVQDILGLGGAAASPSLSISDSRSGFTAGIGLEYAMTENLSALFEYDFFDFGTKTENFSPVIGTPLSIRSELHTLTVGLNYRFNWASGGQPYCPTC